jgi:hypothetical protein
MGTTRRWRRRGLGIAGALTVGTNLIGAAHGTIYVRDGETFSDPR